jgi:transposase
MNRKIYTRDLKLKILGDLKNKSQVQVCKEYNVHTSMIHRWKKEFNINPSQAFRGNGNLWKKEAELERYKKLLGKSYSENQFLKKTLEILRQKREEEKIKSCIK